MSQANKEETKLLLRVVARKSLVEKRSQRTNVRFQLTLPCCTCIERPTLEKRFANQRHTVGFRRKEVLSDLWTFGHIVRMYILEGTLFIHLADVEIFSPRLDPNKKLNDFHLKVFFQNPIRLAMGSQSWWRFEVVIYLTFFRVFGAFGWACLNLFCPTFSCAASSFRTLQQQQQQQLQLQQQLGRCRHPRSSWTWWCWCWWCWCRITRLYPGSRPAQYLDHAAAVGDQLVAWIGNVVVFVFERDHSESFWRWQTETGDDLATNEDPRCAHIFSIFLLLLILSKVSFLPGKKG